MLMCFRTSIKFNVYLIFRWKYTQLICLYRVRYAWRAHIWYIHIFSSLDTMSNNSLDSKVHHHFYPVHCISTCNFVTITTCLLGQWRQFEMLLPFHPSRLVKLYASEYSLLVVIDIAFGYLPR